MYLHRVLLMALAALPSILAASPAGSTVLAAGMGSNSVEEYRALYSAKCSTCHALAKANLAKDILPSDWEDTVGRMARMENANISGEEERMITEYLVYYSVHFKKTKLQRQLDQLPEAERAQEQAKIDAILQKFR